MKIALHLFLLLPVFIFPIEHYMVPGHFKRFFNNFNQHVNGPSEKYSGQYY